MADEKKNLTADAASDKEEVKTKSANKKPNFIVRMCSKLVKFIKDTKGEMKKVVWMSRSDVFKSFKLVIVTVVAVGLAIALIDVVSSFIINTLAGLIG